MYALMYVLRILKMLVSIFASAPGSATMKKKEREKRKKMNVTEWNCVLVSGNVRPCV